MALSSKLCLLMAAAQQEQHSDSEPDSLQGDDVIILQGDGQQGDDDQAELVVRSRVPFSSLVYINPNPNPKSWFLFFKFMFFLYHMNKKKQKQLNLTSFPRSESQI